jgi:hypothetical protein
VKGGKEVSERRKRDTWMEEMRREGKRIERSKMMFVRAIKSIKIG